MAGCALVKFARRSRGVEISATVVELMLVALASLALLVTGQDFGANTPAPTRTPSFSITVTPPSPVLNGTAVTILCSTIEEDERSDIALLHMGTEVPAESRISVDPPVGSATLNRTWTFNPMTVSDTGTYHCRFRVTFSQFSIQVLLVDLSLVTIQACSVYQENNGTYSLTPGHLPLLPDVGSVRRNGSDVVPSAATSVLVCELTTRGPINLADTDSYWFRRTRRASQPTNVTSGGQSDARVRTEFRQMTANGNVLLWLAILTIEDASSDDAGNHTLALLSSAGAPLNMTTCDAMSETCNYPVVLQTPPIVTEGLENFEIAKGNAATAECVASGVPVPVIGWFIHDTPIAQSGDANGRFLGNRVSPWNGMPFDVRSVLTISEAQYADRGYIRCEASSANGNTSSTALFRVRDPLGPLWPLLGIFGMSMLLMLIIAFDRYLRGKSEESRDEIDGEAEGDDEPDGDGGHDGEHLSLLFRRPHQSKDTAPTRLHRKFSESEL